MTRIFKNPICPVCNKKVVHRTVKLSCWNCFSNMVKNDTWANYVLNGDLK